MAANVRTGAVLSNTSKVLPQPDAEREIDGDDEDEDQRIEVRVTEEVGEFDEVVVWGHEVAPDATEDPYSKGISELLAFAEAVSRVGSTGETGTDLAQIHSTTAHDGTSGKQTS